MSEEDREKLRVLLDHWVEHNEEHNEKFKEWAEKAGNIGESGVRDDILEAVKQMNSVNRSLTSAADRLKR
ncbi:MAG: hypothetical protein SVY53_09120 [Chloroflexota bacterium]|nr:hypothetical protein [Chloroflexota bacterium]